jgi:hypothetical protein
LRPKRCWRTGTAAYRGAWQLYGFAAGAQVSQPSSYPDKARTGNGSGFFDWRSESANLI